MNAVEFVRIAAYIVLFGFMWNLVRGMLPDGQIRRGMSAIYN